MAMSNRKCDPESDSYEGLWDIPVLDLDLQDVAPKEQDKEK